jgi:selenocysteine-specific elongation factor
VIIGTAGHVDHGKTTLVRALTGVDTDRLPEEKRRGMTIDLGYAYQGALGFVDVPGHERFVHTMLAGAGGIDAALLVVAADDGVMPQTIEHVQILDLLGIATGIVALTRIDRAPGRPEEAIGEVARRVRALLAPTALRDAPVLPVSAVTGEGVEELRAALHALAQRIRDSDSHPRLAIDRAFTIAGAGLVVTGTLLTGRIAAGDRLMLSPAGLSVRVRGLHAQNSAAAEAEAGQRVALNITGAAREKIERGDWVLHPEAHAPTMQIDARIRLLPEARPLKADTTVHLHLAAAHQTARLAPLAGPIDPGGDGFVRLTLERPIGALALDRIVLRDAGANATIGGGVVLDPWPPRRGARTPARLAQLSTLDQPTQAAFAAQLDAGWLDFSPFARARNLTDAGRAVLLTATGALAAGGFALRTGQLDAMHATLLDTLAKHHREHPNLPGLSADRLRPMLALRPPPALFRALIEAALRRGALVQDGPFLRLPAHAAALSPQDERVWNAARTLIAVQRFSPPRTRDLVPEIGLAEVPLRASLKRLARLGRLVEVAPDHFFLAETVAEMAAIAAALERDAGTLATGAFRDRLGIGRRVAIRVLEFFDTAGITRRTGDTRRVRPERLPAHAGSPR